jgi:hypothetical protein
VVQLRDDRFDALRAQLVGPARAHGGRQAGWTERRQERRWCMTGTGHTITKQTARNGSVRARCDAREEMRVGTSTQARAQDGARVVAQLRPRRMAPPRGAQGSAYSRSSVSSCGTCCSSFASAMLPSTRRLLSLRADSARGRERAQRRAVMAWAADERWKEAGQTRSRDEDA